MISILLPIYNGVEFMEESISSIINQTFTEWELLIGINGYQPNSEVYKIAKKYETKCEYDKIRVFDFFQFKSKSDTLNLLVKYCKHNWIALMDVDDIWENNKLKCQINFIDDFDVIGTRAIYFGDRLNGIIPRIPFGNITNHNFQEENPIINSSCLIKKELCIWNNENDGIEDYELWLKIYSMGKKFYNCEEITVRHRLHNSSSFNTNNYYDKINEIRNKYIKEDSIENNIND